MYGNKHKNNPSVTSPEIVRQNSIKKKKNKKKIFITQKLLRILHNYIEQKPFKICSYF